NGNYSAILTAGRVATSVTRTWTDGNKNFNPDCDLSNPQANGECGIISDLNFGSPTAPPSLSFDEAILKGWGTRPSDWIIGATVQPELLPRVSLSFGYILRLLNIFIVTVNLASAASDFTP